MNGTPRDDAMDVIRGTTRPKQRRRWWTPRPGLRLVRDPRVPQSADDLYALAMIGSLGLSALAFAVFVAGWTGR